MISIHLMNHLIHTKIQIKIIFSTTKFMLITMSKISKMFSRSIRNGVGNLGCHTLQSQHHLSHTIFNKPPRKVQILSFSTNLNGFTEWMKVLVSKISWFISQLICKDWFSIIKMIVNVITRPVMKLEHPEDLSFFTNVARFCIRKYVADTFAF